jgi:hypothetical protein
MTESSDKDTTFTTLEELSELVAALSTPFACRGVVPSRSPARIRFRDGQVVSFRRDRSPARELEILGARRLFQGLYSGTGFYGNEASDTDFYVTAVLELTFERYRVAEGGGRRVRHPRFGPGVVVSRPPGSADKVRVLFDDGDERTLLESFLRDAE